MPIYFGKIEVDSSFKQLLSAFKVTLRYLRRVENESFPIETTIAVAENGAFQLDIDDDAKKDSAASVIVAGPTSEAYFGSLLPGLLAPNNELKPIKIATAAPKIVLKDLPLTEREPVRRMTVRVFVADGAALTGEPAARTYVQLFGKQKGQDALAPIASGTTDANGYLSLTVHTAPLDRLVARTGSAGDTNETEIALLDDGTPPDKIILTVSKASAGEGDCNCDLVPPRLPDAAELAESSDVFSTDLGAGCEDFTVPNRTLEEFDFYKIVRTTDPDIQGLTLPDSVTAEIAGTQMIKVAFDRGTLSAHLKTNEISAQTSGLSTPAADVFNRSTVNAREARPGLSAGANSINSVFTGSSQPSIDAAEAPLPDRLENVLPNYLDVRPLEATGAITDAMWRDATDEKTAEDAMKASLAKIPAVALKAALQDPDGFTPVSLMTLERRSSAEALRLYLNARRKTVARRGALTQENPVDWDQTPEFYQATSIAHGHLLHFKQEWKADGYSLGELVKSIPLAPGQKKITSMVQWDRVDAAAHVESRVATESLSAYVSHDRDINEIASSAFHESIRGGSTAKTGAVGGGFGFAIGPLVVGGGGGSAWSSSTAWNDGSRDLAAQTLNQLRDNTSQGVSTVRDQRATVIETVSQQERVTAITEVIANHNRCHAMTMQYFEVLRHFAVQERLAGVQECLFVPLQMTLFDDAKVLRWRDILTNACRKRALTPGFESIWRLSSPATTPPNRAFADDAVEELNGRMFLRVSIARPKDPDDTAQAALEQTEWRFFGWILRVNPEVVYAQYRRNEQKRDQIFRTEIAPETARLFIESLRVVLIDRDGAEHDAGLDLTLLSKYTEGGLMEVALNDTGNGPRLTRREITGVEIRTDFGLPEFSQVIVERAELNYQTERFGHSLYNNDRVLDDVLKGDPAFLSTSSLSRAEERNQLKEDRERRRKLLRHLNDNIEYYHRMLWWQLDANRRFMLLDGFEAPHSGGRSVASVVENRLIGIVGNALVLPVAPGFQLDPALRQVLQRDEDPLVALQTLYDLAPSNPRRHSVPTKGVFAEAMNGKCNSCEVIEEDRFWRWKDFPLPDSPPPIGELSTDSRFAAPGSLSPTAFPDALIKFQEISAAPNPTGMQAALDLLGKDVFKDLTGLTENQKNAMAALTTAMGTSEAFAGEAFKLSMAQEASRNLDRTLNQIEAANKSGLLTNEEASKATRDALLRSLGEDGSGNKDVTEQSGVTEALNQLGNAPSGSATVTRSNGENTETVSVTKENGTALAIGSAPKVRPYPDPIVIKTPAIIDFVSGIDFSQKQALNTREVKKLRFHFYEKGIVDNQQSVIDIFESAKIQGLLDVDGKNFTIKAKVQIAYPADPADANKIAEPAVKGTKYPLVVFVHGNAAHWSFRAPFAKTTSTESGFPVVTATIDSQPNHEGYKYLMESLTEPGRDMVSISIDMNLPNKLNALVEMRAQMIADVLTELESQSKKSGSLLFNKVDFKNIGLVGHSRGGEAVVQAVKNLKSSSTLGIRAVCSLAPTDGLGISTNNPLSVVAAPNIAYLVFYGGMDYDINGMRTPGQLDIAGTGFRLYDRSTANKAMVFMPFCCHSRFNTVWEKAGLDKAAALGLTGIQIEAGIGLPGTVIPGTDHQKLAKDYIGGFFDLVLNRDATLRPLFDNTQKSPSSQQVAIQWRFGTTVEDIDTFKVANPLRTDPPTGASVLDFVPTKPPSSAVTGSRNRHVGHQTKALVIDTTAVGSGGATVVFKLAPGAGAVKDLGKFDLLTFGLGLLYPITDQTAIDGTTPLDFTVTFTDKSAKSVEMLSSELYSAMANGWTKPSFKGLDSKNITVLFQQTVPVFFDAVKKKAEAQTAPAFKLAETESISFKFNTSAAPKEIWLTNVNLVKK
jgi:hypothetical protein